jgi:LysR family glycine cleavage system transcriptional activator
LPLFRRLPRALELSPAGIDYLSTLRDASIRSRSPPAGSRAANSQHSVLTVSVLPTLAMNWIVPSLHEFNEQHPEIEIHMVMSISPVDFKSDIDMGDPGGLPPSAGQRAAARPHRPGG